MPLFIRPVRGSTPASLRVDRPSHPGTPVVWAVLLLLGWMAAERAEAVVRRDERSKECVICHITWGDDYRDLENLLPPTRYDVTIDGFIARNSSEEMCFSCHDGYVADDRAVFAALAADPHLKVWETPPDSLALRLDRRGEIYCGTCHTPHEHRMGRKYEFIPFLKRSIDRSQLCLECHQDHAESNSHPLHAELVGAGVPGAPEATAGRVECLSCHRVHSAEHLRLPPRQPVSALCSSCHQPQMSVAGSAHDLTRSAEAPKDVCLACHDLHGARGATLWARAPHEGELAAGEDGRCLDCHREGGAAGEHLPDGWGHPLGRPAPEAAQGLLPLPDGGVSCTTCHDPHRGPEPAAGPAGETVAGTEAFLRLGGAGDTGLCVLCHDRQAWMVASDHGPVEPAFAASAEAAGVESSALRPGNADWACAICHRTHGSQPFTLTTVGAPTTDSGLCLGCHGAEPLTGMPEGLDPPTPTGRHSHPLGVVVAGHLEGLPVQGADPRLPLPAEGGALGCATCHDPHAWSPSGELWSRGKDGDEGSSFLRMDNRDGTLCLRCHEDRGLVAFGPHAVAGQPGASLCAACHAPHDAALKGLVRKDVAVLDPEPLIEHSPWPGDAFASRLDSWNEDARACLGCHHSPEEGQRAPKAWGHPPVPVSVPPDPVQAAQRPERIGCFACHDPHLDSEGLLARESRRTVCAECHGATALWKYRFYHDPVRRGD